MIFVVFDDEEEFVDFFDNVMFGFDFLGYVFFFIKIGKFRFFFIFDIFMSLYLRLMDF